MEWSKTAYGVVPVSGISKSKPVTVKLTLTENYEPLLSEEWEDIIGYGNPIAPGVQGYAILKDNLIFIPLINAMREGSGDVGRFLDSLSSRCVIVNVTSDRLRGMLIRRKWKLSYVQDEWFKSEVDVWLSPKLDLDPLFCS